MTNFNNGKKTGHMKKLLTPQNWSNYFFTITQVEYLLIKGVIPISELSAPPLREFGIFLKVRLAFFQEGTSALLCLVKHII